MKIISEDEVGRRVLTLRRETVSAENSFAELMYCNLKRALRKLLYCRIGASVPWHWFSRLGSFIPSLINLAPAHRWALSIHLPQKRRGVITQTQRLSERNLSLDPVPKRLIAVFPPFLLVISTFYSAVNPQGCARLCRGNLSPLFYPLFVLCEDML